MASTTAAHSTVSGMVVGPTVSAQPDEIDPYADSDGPTAAHVSQHARAVVKIDVGAKGVLLNNAGFFDHRDVSGGAAIADRRLVGVHLNDRVINAHARKRGENVLDGVNLHRALDERCRALDGPGGPPSALRLAITAT